MAEIIEFKPRVHDVDEDAPLRKRPRDPSKRLCMHQRLELDQDVRRVYCKDCESEVDLFDALVKFARDFERHVEHRDRAKHEARRAQERLTDIKRQVRNAKAQLRRVSNP